MSWLRDMVDRARASTRRETTGREDGWGMLVDPEDSQKIEETTPDGNPVESGSAVPGAATVPAVTGGDVGAPGQAPVVAVRPVSVPRGVDIAAAWSWRVLVLAAAGYLLYRLLGYFSPVVVPVSIAVLITALAVPAVDLLDRLGLPRGLAAAITVLLGLAAISALLTLVGTQVSAQFDELRVSVLEGLDEVQQWMQDGPFQLSQGQVNRGIDQLEAAIAPGDSPDENVVDQVASVGNTVSHVFTGFFIALFTVIFLLYDGARVWSWIVRLFPRSARAAVDSSGRVAWVTLTAFVRATVLVALVDALGIALIAYFLDVPLALAIGVLVFLGSFVPVVGAFVSGGVACLVALVDQDAYTALAMFVGVLVVQQVESHILQPFLMGRFVQLHPLAVVLAIAGGVVVAGIVGALVAVPLVACANAVGTHLAALGERPPRSTGSAVRVRRV